MDETKKLNAINDDKLEGINVGSISPAALAAAITGGIIGAGILITGLSIGIPYAKKKKSEKDALAQKKKEANSKFDAEFASIAKACEEDIAANMEKVLSENAAIEVAQAKESIRKADAQALKEILSNAPYGAGYYENN